MPPPKSNKFLLIIQADSMEMRNEIVKNSPKCLKENNNSGRVGIRLSKQILKLTYQATLNKIV